MAAMLRISGHVTFVDVRHGNKDGRSWSMTDVTILVGGRETTTITLADHLPTPSVGDEVDYFLEVGAGLFNNSPVLRLRAVGEFPVSSYAG